MAWTMRRDQSVGSNDDAEGSDAPRARIPDIEALRPVTIRQLLDAEQAHTTAPFTIDGVEVHQVTLVAHVTRIFVTENKIDYRLEDGTSTPGITASQWLSDTYEESRLDFLEQGKIYARIRGRLSRWGRDGKNEVKVISIRKSTDPHEIYFHILETFFATKYIECGPQLISVLPHPQNSHVMVGAEPPESDPQITTTGDIPPVGRPINDCSTTTSKRDKPPESDFTSSTSSSRSRDPLSHLDVLQRGIILQILDAPPHPDGVHVGSIARGIAHMGVNTEQVIAALDFLLDERYIEMGCTESYYKVTSKVHTDHGIYGDVSFD